MKHFIVALWVVWAFAWNPVEGASSYRLYYWKESSPSIIKKVDCPSSPCSITVDGRYAWWIYVTALGNGKESDRSDKLRIYRGKETRRVK